MATPIRTLTSAGRPPACAVCGQPTLSRARQVESIARCAHCDQDVCWIDGIPLSQHRRCAACQVLVGPRHATTTLHDGVCESCESWLAKGLTPAEDETYIEDLAVGG